MSLKSVIEQFNLKDKKADVYLACLELGSATATQISKKAGITRPYFYEIADHLIKRGLLVQARKGKKRIFTANDPERLKESQQKKLEELEQIMPQLKSIFKTTGKKPKVYFYEGIEGINQINKDALQYKGEQVGFSTEKFLSAEDKELSKEYIKKRIKNKIPARVIGPVSDEFVNLKKRDAKELRQTRMLPKNFYDSDVEIMFYGNKMVILNYKEHFGLIIESFDVVKPMKMIFELIWRGGFVIE